MKRILCVIISAIICLSTMSSNCIAASQNLCKNGSFEENTLGWFCSNASIQRSDKYAAAGKFSAKVSVTLNYGAAMYTYNFKKGVNYIVSAKIRMEEGSGTHGSRFIISHTAYGSGNPKWHELAGGTPVNDKEWSLITASFCYNGENKTGKGDIQIRIDDGTKPVEFYMDDFQIISESNLSYRETEYEAGEMIDNKGFDVDTEGWETQNAAIVRIAGEGYDNSEASAFVETGNNGYAGQKLEFVKGQKYRISTYVKTSGNAAFFSIMVKHSDGTSEPVALLKPSDEEWNKVEGEYTHRRGDEAVTVYITSNNTSRFYFDDFSVIPLGGADEQGAGIKAAGVYVNEIKANIPYIRRGENVLCDVDAFTNAVNGKCTSTSTSAVATKGINLIRFNDGTKLYTKNSRVYKATSPAVINDGKIFADIYALAEGLACKVEIAENVINITFNNSRPLNNTARRLRGDKKLSIGFLTGSSPRRGGTVDPYTEPVSTIVGKWFEKNYPDCIVNTIEDDVTTSGSELGAFRVDAFVKSNGIDLLVVDLYRNDIKEDSGTIERYVESMVRSAKHNNPNIDIIFLYSLNEDIAKQYSVNMVPKAYEGYEKNARVYGIPTLNIGELLYKKYTTEGKNYNSYHSQNKNPNSAGTEFYAQKIIELIKEKLLIADESSSEINRSQSASFIGMIDSVDNAVFDGGWMHVGKRLSESETQSYVESAEKNSELSYKFVGNVIGLYFQSAQDCGNLLYSIDGEDYKELSTFDEWAYKYEHMRGVILADKLANGSHTLKLRVGGTKNENSMNTYIRIGGFLVGTDE